MRSHTLLRHLAAAAVLALPAGAQVTRTNFSEFYSDTTTEYQGAIGAPLTSGGLDFYNAIEFQTNPNFPADNAFGVWGPNDRGGLNLATNLNGSTAIFARSLGSEIDIFAAGANVFGPSSLLPSFGLASIDFAHLFSQEWLGTQPSAIQMTAFTVNVFGQNSRGEVFGQGFLIPLPGDRRPFLTTARLNSRFSDVNNVWFNQGTGSGRAFQFTNVTPTPEPASLALLGTGLLGVVGMTVRRRRKDLTEA